MAGDAVASSAVDLLSVDAEAIAASASKIALEQERAYIEGLSSDELFSTVEQVQAELRKAMAALGKKGGSMPGAAAATNGPCALFEGMPIDCGAVADAAIAACLNSMSTADLEAMVSATEAELAKAKAALESKRGGASTAADASAPPSTKPGAAAASSSATASTASATPPESPGKLLRKVSSKAVEALSPALDMGMELLDGAEAKTGVPKSTLAAGIIGGAVAAGVAFFSGLMKRR